MKISDLNFEQHPVDPIGTRAVATFVNGYGASVVTGAMFYTDLDHPYELAVQRGDLLCYDTPITDDVLGYLNAEEVNVLLDEIEALPDDWK